LGNEKPALIRRFGLEEMAERSKVFPKAHGWFKYDETCLATLNDPEAPISALILSDQNTNGLGGNWQSSDGLDSRFYNLVLSIYASHKQEKAEGLLGSYGVGKMVYAVTSSIRTMAYYSCFEATESTNGASARFMATAFLPSHRLEGRDFTGHAFFGASSNNSQYPVKPLIDADAHEFAKSVGLEVRSTKDTGLTVMLLDCNLAPKECRDACEKFWWPRTFDEHAEEYVELEFFDGDTRLTPPMPKDSTELKPFIDCFSNIKQSVKPEGYESNKIKLSASGEVGHLCMKALRETEAEHNNFVNSVALIRNGLVIEYNSSYAREDDPDAIGVFEAKGELPIRCFTLSEPEAHDQWNHSNSRLERSLGEDAVTLVRLTHDRIKASFRDFQTRQKTVSSKSKSEGLDFLDDILGPIFRKRKEGLPSPPQPAKRAFTIHKKGWRDLNKKPIIDCLDFTIALAEGVSLEPVSCKVKAILHVLQDADAKRGTSVSCNVCDKEGELISSGSGTFEVSLTPDVALMFHASARVKATWRTLWTVTVARSSDVN